MRKLLYVILAILILLGLYLIFGFKASASQCQHNCYHPTPTPTPTPKPCKKDDEERRCPKPTPTVEPTVVPTVTPTPTVEQPKGDDRGDYHPSVVQTPQAPTCTIPFESARVWYTKKDGKVFFNWATDAQDIQKFSIVYGKSADKLVYGVDNIPSTSRSLEIKGLTGRTFFQVWTWVRDCAEKSVTIDP